MATLTIKNLPDEIYAALSRAATRNRRSINSEAIISVERGIDRESASPELLERIRRNREKLAEQGVYLTDKILAESRAELLRRPTKVMAELEAGKKTLPRKVPRERK